MGKYQDLVVKEGATPKIEADRLGGWPSVAAAYRELSPDMTYGAFYARIRAGKSAVEAGTMPRTNRGRPRKQV